MTDLFTNNNSLFTQSKFEDAKLAPDAGLDSGLPAADFVLCRDRNGNPTAVYGDNIWDFNPYRLAPRANCKIIFDSIFNEHCKETESLIGEVKHLLYCLIYHASSGHIGRISISTLLSYHVVIRRMAKFCYSMKENELVGVISLQNLLTNQTYLAALVSSIKSSSALNKKMPALLLHFTTIGQDYIGYKVCSRENLKFGSIETNQYPVIPSNIYFKLINHWSDLLDQFADKGKAISCLLFEFKKTLFGHSPNAQRSMDAGGIHRHEMTFEEAISKFELDQVFSGSFSCKSKLRLPTTLKAMQFVVKNIIHLYTGMRDQEVNRLPYDCLGDKEISKEVCNDKGVVLDNKRDFTIISTTTKFTGYKKEESWIASKEVVRAVKFLQEITKSLSVLGGYKLSEAPLFITPTIISRSAHGDDIPVSIFIKKNLKSFPNIIIQNTDLKELKVSDPERNFDAEEKFSVGENWPLTSHQYRRSLAFYASNSGIVSLPSLKKQFKHVTRQMTQYYCNGFENIKSIFGSYNETTGEYELPSSHIAFEFQMAVTTDAAHQLIAHLNGSDGQLLGGAGNYIEKQKADGEINIEEFRKDTEKRFAKGELAYKETLLGGCTKIGECDEHMLGDVTSCLSCPGAIIKSDKLSAILEQSENELANYKVGTGEHFVVKAEVDKLRNFQERKIKKHGS